MSLRIIKSNICPVCGYDSLEEAPYDINGNPSYTICPCCGFEFGFDDSSKGYTFTKYREKWIDKGFPFFDEEKKPSRWNKNRLLKQLKNIRRSNFNPRTL